MSAPLTVVLVHWNQPERCIDTGRAFLEQGRDVRLLVVDNASEPGALDAIRVALPDAEILVAPDNLGFGGGANLGWGHWLADPHAGEWVALAPHDAMPAPGALDRLLAAVADRPRAGLACAEYGDARGPTGIVGGRPVVHPFLGAILEDSNGPMTPDGWEDADYPHGTLMLARRGCLADIGLFDERYFAYCEEADLGERARRAGWQVGIVWGALVANPVQNGGHAVVDYLMLRNSLLLVRDHFGLGRVAFRIGVAVLSTAWLALRPSRRPYHYDLGARIRAVRDFARGRFGPPPPTLATPVPRREPAAEPA